MPGAGLGIAAYFVHFVGLVRHEERISVACHKVVNMPKTDSFVKPKNAAPRHHILAMGEVVETQYFASAEGTTRTHRGMRLEIES
jgi:hypothetical protein